ncbi:MAG TPA: hypothetical protein GX517_13365 [Alicyclobacillus sp.]|nr:hypothetical protein [Alicyclobacillus sp.]
MAQNHNKSKEQLEELAEMDPAIKKAKTLEFLSQEELHMPGGRAHP